MNSDQAPTLCVVGSRRIEGTAAAMQQCARALGWQIQRVYDVDEQVVDERVSLALLEPSQPKQRRSRFPHALLVVLADGAEAADVDADVVLTPCRDAVALNSLLNHAASHWRQQRKSMQLFREVGARRERMRQLSDIALSLSTQIDFDDLLETILLEARRLAGCDAGSLYLLDENSDPPSLIFKLSQTDSLEVTFREQRLPLSSQSLAGYVAQTGESLEIPDAYAIPEDAPYRFNRSFDEKMGYRTRSILVLPMRDHRGKVVGVLQFINRLDPTKNQPIPFGEEVAELLRAVGSQAAVSIQKNLLIRDVNQLFEGFVQASVKAIEQRDPGTSGHSFRVAESTLALLRALPESGNARFKELTLSDAHLREVRYAALLHDFGKVGVREHVLLKANKLSDDRLELLNFRVELQKERLRRQALERELELFHHGKVDLEVARRRVQRELGRQLGLLDDYLDCIRKANNPTVLAEGDFNNLREIRNYAYRELDGTQGSLISDSDLLALSVRKGSLTPDERLEIQNHVSHTRDFLAVLPWPPELAGVPRIAAAHHEKLDGSGYPDGLVDEQIPLPSKVMAVCDIYDALTAMDRPYKSAISAERALGILEEEARSGLLDSDIVKIFIDAGVYESVWGEQRKRVG